jgi:FkbM family methyltransferase
MYSQNDEEQHILSVFEGDMHLGRFLEIGAYNPKLFSNTRRLFELGWSGVMIEPSPGPFLDLFIEYGTCDRVELVCAAVGVERDIKRFHWSEDMVGTTDEAHYQKWRSRAAFEGVFFTPVVTVIDLTSAFGRDFDFVNIDVEGGSAELFLDAVNYLKPKCWCVEHDHRQQELIPMAKAHSYDLVHLNTENLIFRRAE